MRITFDEFIQRQRDMIQALLTDQKPLFLAAQSALADMSERIFIEGKSVSGGKFTYNDTTPLYVNPKTIPGNASKLTPKGKHGQTVFKSGKPHKTAYVRSYKELRSKIGKESSFVNWELSGELKSDVENRASGGVTPKKVNETEYIVSVAGKNGRKLSGLMIKYPGVFQIAPKEKETFYRVFDLETRKLIFERTR